MQSCEDSSPSRGSGFLIIPIYFFVSQLPIQETDIFPKPSDYDEAKRLRDGINRLKAVGAKVAQLEHRKRSAIEAEDYDAAKVIKSEIDKLREAGGVVALGESVGAGSGGGGRGHEQIFNRALEANGSDVLRMPDEPPSPGGMSQQSGRVDTSLSLNCPYKKLTYFQNPQTTTKRSVCGTGSTG